MATVGTEPGVREHAQFLLGVGLVGLGIFPWLVFLVFSKFDGAAGLAVSLQFPLVTLRIDWWLLLVLSTGAVLAGVSLLRRA